MGSTHDLFPCESPEFSGYVMPVLVTGIHDTTSPGKPVDRRDTHGDDE